MVSAPFQLPATSAPFVPDVIAGQLMGWNTPAGFPTFGTLPHSASLIAGKVNIFGHLSKKKSLIIRVENDDEQDMNPSAVNVAKQVMGKVVFVQWPYLTEAKVIAVEDERVSIHGIDWLTLKSHSQRMDAHLTKNLSKQRNSDMTVQ